ncbi:MAG: hypothetical protein ACYC1M_07420 [Armatimonadota bacterium]
MSSVVFSEMTDQHRRGISVTLVMLDQNLCRIARWAEGREAQSVMFEERNELRPDQRVQLLEQVAELRAKIAQIKECCGLKEEAASVVNSIFTICFGLRDDLVDLEPTFMRRYGELSTELAEFLDGASKEILQKMDGLASIVKNRSLVDNQAERD